MEHPLHHLCLLAAIDREEQGVLALRASEVRDQRFLHRAFLII
jgi:hypothetical protein